MLLEEVTRILPFGWYSDRFEIIKVPRGSREYDDVEWQIFGHYYLDIVGIYKVHNPLLYAKYRLKCGEYSQRGPYKVLTLFHDTPTVNVQSIIMHNFDWRYGSRFMFGPGVYFSVSPTLANRHASRSNSVRRSMFLANVLVQNVQTANGDIFLPDEGYDTVLAHNKHTYVKYFDSDYYPHYFVDYISH